MKARRGSAWPGIVTAMAESLFPPDPGSMRLRQAGRATIAAVITLGLVRLFGARGGPAPPEGIFGFGMALFMTATLTGETIAEERMTILFCVVAASSTSALAALLLQSPWFAEAGFVLILAAIVYASALGPRVTSLLIVAMVAYVVSLIEALHSAQIPLHVLIAVLAGVVAAGVHGVLMPERPKAVLERVARSVDQEVHAILRRLEEAVRSGYWRRGTRRRLRDRLARLAQAVTVVEARLGAAGVGVDEVRRVVALDLATERLALGILAGLPPPCARMSVAEALGNLRERPPAPLPAMPERTVLEPALRGLSAVLAGRTSAAAERQAAEAIATAPASGDGSPMENMDALRHAAQAALATALAVVIGRAVSGHWYWAGFAAYVVFLGTHSSSESLAKAIRFMLGTTGGVLVGILIATVLYAYPYAALLCIIVAVFLAFDASSAAYGLMVFWLTIILGLLFGLLGYFPPRLLLLRFEEAGIGSACGVAVAFALWRTSRLARRERVERAYLAAMAALLKAVTRCFAGSGNPAELPARMLVAERNFEALRATLWSRVRALALANERVPRRGWRLVVCHYRLRRVVELTRGAGPAGTPEATVIAMLAERIGKRIAAFGGMPAGGSVLPKGARHAQPCRVGEVASLGESRGREVEQLLRSIDRDLGRALA